jgi:hypothetical protein
MALVTGASGGIGMDLRLDPILRAGAGEASVRRIGAVNREMPERSIAPGVSGDERKRRL